MTHRDRELLAPKAARCSFGGSFYLPHILLSVPLIPWETSFLERMLMGREGSSARQRKAEEQALKPSFSIYGSAGAVPTVHNSYCISGLYLPMLLWWKPRSL